MTDRADQLTTDDPRARVRAVTAAVALALVVALSGCASASEGAAPGSTVAPTTTTTGASGTPAPPQLPRDFRWSGRYVVPDLDVEVPFTWEGRDGNSQMVTRDESSPIHFTNVIDGGQLYTLTYTWPDIPRLPCSRVGPFTIDDLNAGFSAAHFVGPETLHEPDGDRNVNHFRANVVWEPTPEQIPLPEGVPVLRFPLMSGDVYTDRDDPSMFWKVLHFGIHNLYARELDEWIIIDEAEQVPGEVDLPAECAAAPMPDPPAGEPSTTAPPSTG